MSKETIYQPVIICPHCAYNFRDCGEYEANEDIVECEKCGKEFSYVREITIEYSTYLIEDEKNGV